MDAIVKYRGQWIGRAEIGFVRELIQANAQASRRELSLELCRAWNWVQPNGALKDGVCRGLLLALERAGHIQLPPSRWTAPRLRRRREWQRVDTTPVTGRLKDLGPLEFRLVRRTAAEPLFNSLIAEHHYLGYTQPVGEQLKYMVMAGNRPAACLGWSSAARHLGPRDRFIGWDAEARRRNIRFIAYNTRYLILPWVQIKFLASHILGQMAARVGRDWERIYGHPVYYLETFVDPGRSRGTCYRAANWIVLGLTTGRGKDATGNRPNRSLKQVLGYPLRPDFRRRLQELA